MISTGKTREKIIRKAENLSDPDDSLQSKARNTHPKINNYDDSDEYHRKNYGHMHPKRED